MIQWKAVKDFKTDGCIFFRYHCASDLAGPACMGFFAWRSFHHRDGRHAQKLRSCVHFQHIQGVQLICVPLGFVNDQTFTNYRSVYIYISLLSKKNPSKSRAILGLECGCSLLMHPTHPKLIHFFFEKGIKFSRVLHLPKDITLENTHLIQVSGIEMNMT